MSMDKNDFTKLVDRAGLTLTDAQTAALFEVYPMFQDMVTRATTKLPREAEPALIFLPEVK
jgi:hypothetical protein